MEMKSLFVWRGLHRKQAHRLIGVKIPEYFQSLGKVLHLPANTSLMTAHTMPLCAMRGSARLF